MLEPIIVIGPPRSGTSNVARILHEHMGVFMGWHFWKPGFAGIQGTYEDRELTEANSLLGMKMIKINAWKRRFKRFVRARQKMNRPWGFKDPRLIPLIPEVLNFFDNPLFIRCLRAKTPTIKSQMQKLGWEKEYAENYYERSNAMIDAYLLNIKYLLIYYPEGVYCKDESFINQLSKIEITYGY